MPVDRYTLPAAKHLKPLSQGELSRLCGLYSHLNAIRLALFPQQLRTDELQNLYLAAVRHLSTRRQLKSVLGAGMAEDVWKSLGSALVSYVNEVHGANLQLELLLKGGAKHDSKRALEMIRRATATGSPVIVMFQGALDHFTVIAGYAHQRLHLFDSSGFRWLNAQSIGVGDDCAQRHCLRPHGVIRLVDDW